MKQLHFPYDIHLYTRGCNRDVDRELVQLSEGECIDAINMRFEAMDSNSGVARKIRGERLLYENIDNSCTNGTNAALTTSYECLATEEINGNIVEFWADAEGTEPSLIRINGKIVCKSPDFPITVDYPLQTDKNESCIGGEVYITDNYNQPMIFNIKDLMENSGMIDGSTCTDKYFDGFNLNEHVLILQSPVDHPVFIKITSSSSGMMKVFGTGGMPVGYYTYQMRFASESGDKTGWSAPTPLIPVVQRDTGLCSTSYPYSQTHSKDPDISNPSPYGVHIRFRVNNKNNYDYVEIRRNRWNTGDAIGTPPVSEVIGFYDVAPQELSIVDILDNGPDFESALSADEAIEALAAIEKAKAIRYFNGRLYLANITYASKDVQAEITVEGENNGTAIFPTIQKVGKDGHKDPYKHTYYKPYLGGEKYGIGVIAFDDNGGFTYGRPITGFENYEYPNRREPVSALTQGSSYGGLVEAADVNGDINYTHEVFDTENCVQKTDLCRFANILDNNTTGSGKLKLTLENYTSDLGETCPIIGGGIYITPHDAGYSPFTPVSQDDSDCDGTDMRVNTYVKKRYASSDIEYNPKGFGPEYFSHGIACKGLTSYPSWMRAFSMVRTQAAGQIVAQGLAFYSLNSAEGALSANTTKNTNKIWLYAPDIDAQIGVNSTAYDAIVASLANYAIQPVSPLGFFSEIYSFLGRQYVGVTQRDVGIDMMTYCRLMKDKTGSNAEINPNESASAGITSGSNYYVGFGKWRSDQFGTNYPAGANGNLQYGIVDIQTVTSGRSTYYEVTLSGSIYNELAAGGDRYNDDTAVERWHEPVYIVNLVRKNTDIADTNVTKYIKTGHYQKISSLIGKSDGTNGQQFPLVDERWEDCMVTVNGVDNAFNDYDSLYRFIYVVDAAGVKRRWVNVSTLSIGTITTILNDLTSFGVASVTDSSGTYQVYGVYTQAETVDNTCPIYSVVFNHFNTSYNIDFFIPTTDYEIYVDYDNRIPVRFWGGDTTVGEAVCAFQDNKYNKNADPETGSDDFRLNLAFPYYMYELNPRIYVINKTKSLMALGSFISPYEECFFDDLIGTAPSRIRQLCAMFTCESRVNLVYAFNDESTTHSSNQSFPLKNYVMRPYRWDDDKFGNAEDTYEDNNIWSQYKDDYGNEYELWGYGGIRFLPQVNLDYSKEDDSGSAITSVPDVGFEEQNEYCTRVIWSLRRPVNAQNTPSVRTFLGANQYDISDDTGEIKYLFDSLSGQGGNIYAFTDSGACMLLVDKRIINEINGNELATVGSETSGILNEIWLSRNIGMNDEMWRSAAEFDNVLYFANKNSVYQFAGNKLEDIGRKKYHSKIYNEFLSVIRPGFQDKLTGVYDIYHNEYWVSFSERTTSPQKEWCLSQTLSVTDLKYNPDDLDLQTSCNETEVGIDQFTELVLNPVAATTYEVVLGGPDNDLLTHPVTICVDDDGARGATVNFVYYDNNGDKQTVATLDTGECVYLVPIYVEGDKPTWIISEKYQHPTLVFSQGNDYWQGAFDYRFDKYLAIDNKLYGMKNLETYELGQGYQINGQNIESHLITASSKNLFDDKEFTRIRINSDRKPVKVDFYDDLNQYLTSNVQATLDTTLNALALKNYYGYEQYIPRRTAAPKNRMQGRLLVFDIIHNLAEDFKIATVGIQSKKLK